MAEESYQQGSGLKNQHNFTIWDAFAVLGGSGGCHYYGIELDLSLNPETINTISFITNN